METNKRRALGRGLEELFYNEPIDYNKVEEKIITESKQEEIISPQQETNTMSIEDLLNPRRAVSTPPKNNIQDVDDFIKQFQEAPKPHLGHQSTPETIIEPTTSFKEPSLSPNATSNMGSKENPIIHQDKIPEKEIDVTDDQFFDDFFDD